MPGKGLKSFLIEVRQYVVICYSFQLILIQHPGKRSSATVPELVQSDERVQEISDLLKGVCVSRRSFMSGVSEQL